MEEKNNLLRCPFCGGEAELYTGYQIARTGEYLANVRCGKCGITVPAKVSLDQSEAEAEAIEAWNRRVVTDINDGSKERTAKVESRKWRKDLTLIGGGSWSGKCQECGRWVKSNECTYCPRCGSRLEWGDHE